MLLTLGALGFGAGFDALSTMGWRAVAALMTALIVSLVIGPRCIATLAQWQRGGVTVREDVPETHQQKQGTPSMGGVLILISALVSIILWTDWRNGFVWAIVAIFLAFALIGFVDDYVKIGRASKGISGKLRLTLEATAAFVFVVWVNTLQGDVAYGLTIPLLTEMAWDIGYFLVPLAVLVIVGSANAVNLTDGLDGLAIMPVMIAVSCFSVIGVVVGMPVWAAYFHAVPVAGVQEMVVVGLAVIGAGMGFLWFNAPPAKVFMGDTGSLALGGFLGGLSVITKQEIVLAIIGGLFVLETLSVIIQVVSFKTRGRRVFAMAPLHHHFEKKGWPETTVVVRFWIIALLFGVVGLALVLLG